MTDTNCSSIAPNCATCDLKTRKCSSCSDTENFMPYSPSNPLCNICSPTNRQPVQIPCNCGSRKTCSAGSVCNLKGQCLPGCDLGLNKSNFTCQCKQIHAQQGFNSFLDCKPGQYCDHNGDVYTSYCNEMSFQKVNMLQEDKCICSEILACSYSLHHVCAQDSQKEHKCLPECTESREPQSKACGCKNEKNTYSICKNGEICYNHHIIQAKCQNNAQLDQMCLCDQNICNPDEFCVKNQCFKQCTAATLDINSCICGQTLCQTGTFCNAQLQCQQYNIQYCEQYDLQNDSSVICTKCQQKTYMDDSMQCQICADQHCLQCNGFNQANERICSQCEQNYRFNGKNGMCENVISKRLQVESFAIIAIMLSVIAIIAIVIKRILLKSKKQGKLMKVKNSNTSKSSISSMTT